MLDFFKKMPKIELHAHLGGSCPKLQLLELLNQYGHHQNIQKILNSQAQSENWFEILFSSTALIMKTKRGLRDYTNQVLKAFAEDNVVYLELRTTPRSGEDYDVVDFFNIIIQESEKFKGKMAVKYIFSLNRDIKNLDIYDSIIENIQKVNNWENHIVGIDFSGNPTSRTFKQFIPFLIQAREIGLKMSIHTAQVTSQIKQTTQILSLKPQRIGHFSYYNQNELQQIFKQGIVVEICISSNTKIKQLQTFLDHHIAELHANKIKHCICTDDILVFERNLSQQYLHYATILNLNQKQCFTQAKETINYIFSKQQQEFIISKFDQFVCNQRQNYHFLT